MTKRKSDEMNLRLPLVIILGATASGKTKLSLDLAKRFGGEIIGADSMQIYKNIDIISAKPTPEERREAPHHLIDILSPTQLCTVIDYRNKALPIIDDLLDKNKLPIVVGGTNYYIESLLWKILIEDADTQREFVPGSNNHDGLSSGELHDRLKQLDPEMARRLHPNNKRKILRSLEVFEQKGKLLSDLIKQQKLEHSTEGGLRYSDTVILWLKWEQEILNERINSRVDAMIKDGLLGELSQFHELYAEQKSTNCQIDYTKGIFQMIGFKEFHDYLMLPESEKSSPTGEMLLSKGVEELKMVTRRYAKRQHKWIRNRFLGRTDREVPPIYALNTDDLAKWDEEITQPAVNIIDCFINGKDCVYESLEPVRNNSVSNFEDDTMHCETCDRVFIGQFQYSAHMQSNVHKRRLEKLKKSKASQS